MKKLFFVLAISFITCACFAQVKSGSVFYELRNVIYDTPVKTLNEDSLSQQVTIVVGIEGDTYGFTQNAIITVAFPMKNNNYDNLELIKKSAIEYIDENFNNKK